MKSTLFLLAACLITSSALAVIDPDPDHMGIYFDLDANQHSTVIPPGVPFYAYVIYTNPTIPAISGYEFGLELVVTEGMESMLFRLSSFPYWGINHPPDGSDILGGEYIVGLPSPYPTSPSTILHVLQYLMLDFLDIEFYLRAISTPAIPGVWPIVFDADNNTPMQVGLSTGGPAIPVAGVNTDIGVGLVESSFGSVKALYR